MHSVHNVMGLLPGLYGQTVVLSTHPGADPDGISSLIVLRNFLENIKAHTIIVLPEGLNDPSKNMLKYFDVNITFLDTETYCRFSLCGSDVLIVTDTNNLWRIGFPRHVLNSFDKIIVIDHHSGETIAPRNTVLLIKPEYSSTAEIVFDLLKDVYPFTQLDLSLLLSGLVYDSGRFANARPETFLHAYEMIRLGGSYSDALKSLRKTLSLPERMARLKAAQRTRLESISDIIVAVTHVGAYEGSVARALLELGADIAFVYSIKKSFIRVTVRVSRELYEKHGIDFSRDILPLLEELVLGKGGGHPTAGSVEGVRVPGNIEDKIIRLIRSVLLKKGFITG